MYNTSSVSMHPQAEKTYKEYTKYLVGTTVISSIIGAYVLFLNFMIASA